MENGGSTHYQNNASEPKSAIGVSNIEQGGDVSATLRPIYVPGKSEQHIEMREKSPTTLKELLQKYLSDRGIDDPTVAQEAAQSTKEIIEEHIRRQHTDRASKKFDFSSMIENLEDIPDTHPIKFNIALSEIDAGKFMTVPKSDQLDVSYDGTLGILSISGNKEDVQTLVNEIYFHANLTSLKHFWIDVTIESLPVADIVPAPREEGFSFISKAYAAEPITASEGGVLMTSRVFMFYEPSSGFYVARQTSSPSAGTTYKNEVFMVTSPDIESSSVFTYEALPLDQQEVIGIARQADNRNRTDALPETPEEIVEETILIPQTNPAPNPGQIGSVPTSSDPPDAPPETSQPPTGETPPEQPELPEESDPPEPPPVSPPSPPSPPPSPDTVPDALDDAYATAFATPVTFDASNGATGLLDNDSDADGDPLNITAMDAVSANGGTIIDNGDGTFTYTPAVGFTGNDTFTYTIEDDDGNADTATVTISVGVAPNAAPVANDATFSVNENSAASTSVGTVTATDADVGDTLSYTITAGNTNVDGDANAAFSIDGGTGEIFVNDMDDLDFETTPAFALTVQVSDDGVPVESDTASITVNLNDVDESPTTIIDNDGDANNIAENVANGTAVEITALSTDPEGVAITYSLTDDAGGRFAIDANSGIVTVADTSLIDFETAISHTITVQATDGTSAPVTQNFTIDVTDAPDLSLTVSTTDLLDTSAGDENYTGIASNWHTGDTVDGGAGNDTLTITSGSVNITIDGTNYTGFEEVETLVLPDAVHSITLDDDYFDRGSATLTEFIVDASVSTQALTLDGSAITDTTHDVNIIAGSGDDTIRGANHTSTTTGDTINAGEGDNEIYGNGGADLITSGSGNDLIDGGTQFDTIDSGEGDDTVDGGNGNDTISLGGGNDIFNDNSQTNVIYGSDIVFGEGGNDTLNGDGANDTLDGGADDDQITGGRGVDSITGGTGTDRFIIVDDVDDAGTATITDFTENAEIIDLTAFGTNSYSVLLAGMANVGADVQIDLAGIGGTGQTLILNNVQIADLDADDFDGIINSTVLTTSLTDLLSTSAGDENYTGIAANWHTGDTVDGGAGNDTLTITSGSVTITIDGANYTGFEEVETLVLPDDTHSITLDDDYFSRGTGPTGGDFTINATAATGDVTVDGGALSAPNALDVTSGSGDDTLTGGAGDDTLNGGNGNDTIDGGGGVNQIDSGAGNDEIHLEWGSIETITPDDVASSSLVLWLDGADLDGDGVQEGAAESGRTGTDLVEWVDKAALGGVNTVTNGVGTGQIADSAINGLAGLQFSGTTSGVASSPFGATMSEATIFFVIQELARGQNSVIGFDGTPGGGPDRTFFHAPWTNGSWYADLGKFNAPENNRVQVSGNPTAVGDVTLATATKSVVAGQNTLSLNGYAFSAVSAGSTIASTDGGLLLTSGNNGADHIIAEIIAFNDTLSGGQIEQIEGYLAHKWGIDNELPGGHAFKLAADTVLGGNNDDTLEGGAGNDTLTITANAVNTTLDGANNLTGFETLDLTGADEAHNITITDGYFSAGTGIAGSNVTLDFTGNTTGVTVNGGALSSPNALDVTTGNGLDSIISGDGDDNIFTDQGEDVISTGNGNDTINGGGQSDTIDAGDGNDQVTGGNGADRISLGGGNDEFIDFPQTGAFGADTVFGGAGNDTITGQGGEDLLEGGADSDTIDGGAEDDVLHGGDAGDSLDGGDGNDIIYGDDGVFQQTAGFIVIEAEHYASKADSNVGSWEIADYAPASGGKVLLLPDGATNNFITGEKANYDVEFTSTGAFYLWVLGTSALRTLGAINTADSLLIELDGVDVTAGPWGTAGGPLAGYDDDLDWNSVATRVPLTITTTGEHTITLLGREDGFAADKIVITDDALFTPAGLGPAENERIVTSGGNDTINGGDGDDTIYGDLGNDTIHGEDGDDTIYGGAGNDTITAAAGTDNLDGGSGEDILDGGAESDTIDGAADDDVIHGGDAGDSLDGSDGNDIIYGDDGVFQQTAGFIVIEAEHYASKVDSADHSWEITDYAPASGGSVLHIADGAANAGNGGERAIYDVEFTSTGTFYLWVLGTTALRDFGGNGAANTVFIEVDGVNVTTAPNNAPGGPLTGFNTGPNPNWNNLTTRAEFTITATGEHTIALLAREDGFAADKILITDNAGFTPAGSGPPENDRIVTSGGNDTIHGGDGDDTIYGDLGSDTITGGLGEDCISGGAAADTFEFDAVNESPAGTRDVITDFQTGIDTIDLTGLGLVFNIVSGNGTAGAGTGDFTIGPGGPEIAWGQSGGNTIVHVDTDGNDTADMEIELSGLLSLDGGDFVF